MTAAGSRRLPLAATVLALIVLSGTTAVARAATGPGNIATLRICSGCPQAGGDLSRYRYVILNSWDAPLLPALRAANPNLKALVYKNLSFTVTYGCSGGVDLPYQTTGVGYCDANANHPDWFLNDPSGARLNSSPFPSARMMDVGNPGYQAKWLSNVLADARSGGWDGVFMDDTNADMGYHLNGRTIAKYPTTAAWRAATRSMLAAVGPALKSAGLLAMPNLYVPWASDYDAQATWSDWLQFTSGGRAGVLLEVGLGQLRPPRRQRLDVPAEVPVADRAGRQGLPRDHLRAEGRRALDGVGAGELPAPRRAREQRRADVRAERPRGAGSLHLGLDCRRRHAERGALPGRRGLAAQLHGRDGARQPDELDGDGDARAALRP